LEILLHYHAAVKLMDIPHHHIIWIYWSSIMVVTVLAHRLSQIVYKYIVIYWTYYHFVSFICGLYWLGVPENKVAHAVFLSGAISISTIRLWKKH
jgi:hypothetical protein